jgi:hypothetical protein
MGIMLAAAIGLLSGGSAAAAQGIPGDCGGDGMVTVDELIVGVNIALGSAAVSLCPSFDIDGDGQVTVDELIVAVNVALTGVTPTPTTTPTATATPTETAVPQQFAFVIATDFQTGSFGTVALDATHTVTQASPARSINSDAVARAFGGLVYVLNRFGADNLQVLDPAHAFATTLQCSTGAGSNPNDIVFVSRTKAYVALYAEKNVLIVNPSAQANCSDFVIGRIDLSAYADSDGIPDMNQLALVGDRLYVSLQRLTNFVPEGPGAIAVIDTTTDTAIDAITLSGANPFGESKGLPVVDGALVVSEVGKFGVNDGGIERVDLTSATAQGFFVTEDELGGDVSDFVLVSDHLGYALVSKPDFTTSLEAFDPETGAVTQTLLSGGNLADIEIDDRGQLFVADRDLSHPGIRIFLASDGTQLTSAPLDLGLPPFDIVFVP